MNDGLVGFSSRGLRWHALQVSEKICAGDLPASRFDCAWAAAPSAIATSPGTIQPTLDTVTLLDPAPASVHYPKFWAEKRCGCPVPCRPSHHPQLFGNMARCRNAGTLF